MCQSFPSILFGFLQLRFAHGLKSLGIKELDDFSCQILGTGLRFSDYQKPIYPILNILCQTIKPDAKTGTPRAIAIAITPL